MQTFDNLEDTSRSLNACIYYEISVSILRNIKKWFKTLSQTKPCVCSTSLLKTLWEKEQLLWEGVNDVEITLSHTEIVIYKSFQFGQG